MPKTKYLKKAFILSKTIDYYKIKIDQNKFNYLLQHSSFEYDALSFQDLKMDSFN